MLIATLGVSELNRNMFYLVQDDFHFSVISFLLVTYAPKYFNLFTFSRFSFLIVMYLFPLLPVFWLAIMYFVSFMFTCRPISLHVSTETSMLLCLNRHLLLLNLHYLRTVDSSHGTVSQFWPPLFLKIPYSKANLNISGDKASSCYNQLRILKLSDILLPTRTWLMGSQVSS